MMNSSSLRVGVAQLRSSDDVWENLLQLMTFVQDAKDKDLDVLCFPENLFYRGPKKGAEREDVLEIGSDGLLKPTSAFARELSEVFAHLPCALSLGSVLQTSENSSKPYNSHWLVRPRGEKSYEIAAYQKIHLFDFQGAHSTYRESDDYSPGEMPRVANLETWNLGLSICYDLRFPELFRTYSLDQKVDLLLIPAAFTRETGEAHWHTLLRARAIENQVFVVASGQWGAHQGADGLDRFCYGHSLVYDPWGELLAEAPAEGDALLVVDLKRDRLNQVRAKLPALTSAVLWK